MKKIVLISLVVLFASCKPITEYVEKEVPVQKYKVEYVIESDIGYVHGAEWTIPGTKDRGVTGIISTTVIVVFNEYRSSHYLYAYTRHDARITTSIYIDGVLRGTNTREKGDDVRLYSSVLITEP